MKNKLILLLFPFLLLASCTKEQLDEALKGNNTTLSNEDIIAGLKEALNVGTDTSVSILNKLDGYYKDELVKILLPPEAAPVYDNLKNIPGGPELIDKTILAMNRAAEDAAIKAKPIFVDAITGITINDGLSILKGTDTAATHYLRDATYSPLKAAFQPDIETSLAKPIVLGISASSAYSDLITFYNNASFNGVLWNKINTNSLSDHVTSMALNGLFLKVAEEERSIRKDPVARVTDILKKVFGQQ
jgi:hypothetical protein